MTIPIEKVLEYNHKFLSYNILIGHEFYEAKFLNIKSEYLGWNFRSHKIRNVINECDFGILVESINELLPDIISDKFANWSNALHFSLRNTSSQQ